MSFFEKPPLDSLPFFREKWTPVYLEHGRLEVFDSGVQWIDENHEIFKIPIAQCSAIMLGPGTSVTHSAIKALGECDTPVCWVGTEGIKFYSCGVTSTHDNSRARAQACASVDKDKSEQVARRMFLKRFSDIKVDEVSVQELRGYEGQRVKSLYKELGNKYNVAWQGRNYEVNNFEVSDSINKAISIANSCLYALTLGVVCSMGYLPQLGFIHTAGCMPFVCDIADMYKPLTTLQIAFSSVSEKSQCDYKDIVSKLKSAVESNGLMKTMSLDIPKLFADL